MESNASGSLTITAQHEAPQAVAVAIPDALPHAKQKKKQLSAEDVAELTRLQSRAQAEPTSFRAQQELASFKALRGIV